jgi:hypothetical protein
MRATVRDSARILHSPPSERSYPSGRRPSIRMIVTGLNIASPTEIKGDLRRHHAARPRRRNR